MSSSTSLTNTLALVQKDIILYVYPFWLIFGITGCVLDLIVFSRRKLRTTTCSICKYRFFSLYSTRGFYQKHIILLHRLQYWLSNVNIFFIDFFAASLDHLMTLMIGIGPEMYTLNHPDPQLQSLLFCKLRNYLFQICLMLSRYYISFACIDRYALTLDKAQEILLREKSHIL